MDLEADVLESPSIHLRILYAMGASLPSRTPRLNRAIFQHSARRVPLPQVIGTDALMVLASVSAIPIISTNMRYHDYYML